MGASRCCSRRVLPARSIRALNNLPKPAERRLDVMTVTYDYGGVSRRKTTVYLDADVLTATKMLAAARNDSESQVVEDALRAYLQAGQLQAAAADLRALMHRLAERADLSDDEAMSLAVEEVRAVRGGRRDPNL